MRNAMSKLLAVAFITVASPALAQDPPPADPAAPPAPPPADPAPPASPPPPAVDPIAAPEPTPASGDSAAPTEKKGRGKFLAGAMFGGIAPFDGLNPFIVGTIEVGYITPWLDEGIAGLVAVSYTAPSTGGTQDDPRVPTGSYEWTITQHELVIAPTVMYRYTKLGRIIPFVGIGPRIYLMRTVTSGKAGEEIIGETSEISTQIGGGLPLGVEYQLGPGALAGYLLFESGTLDHEITGSSHTTALSLHLGYRLQL